MSCGPGSPGAGCQGPCSGPVATTGEEQDIGTAGWSAEMTLVDGEKAVERARDTSASGTGGQGMRRVALACGVRWLVDSRILPGAGPDGAIIEPEPSRAEPSRAEPSRAEPSRAEPSRAEPSRAEPSRAEPSRAEPSRAEPSRAEPSLSSCPPGRVMPRLSGSRSGRPPSSLPSAPLGAYSDPLPTDPPGAASPTGRGEPADGGGQATHPFGNETVAAAMRPGPSRRTRPAP